MKDFSSHAASLPQHDPTAQHDRHPSEQNKLDLSQWSEFLGSLQFHQSTDPNINTNLEFPTPSGTFFEKPIKVKRKPGRPKGSKAKNKTKVFTSTSLPDRRPLQASALKRRKATKESAKSLMQDILSEPHEQSFNDLSTVNKSEISPIQPMENWAFSPLYGLQWNCLQNPGHSGAELSEAAQNLNQCVACGKRGMSLLDLYMCSQYACRRLFCRGCSVPRVERPSLAAYSPAHQQCLVCRFQSRREPKLDVNLWHFEFKDEEDAMFVRILRDILPAERGLFIEVSKARQPCWRRKLSTGVRKHFSFRYHGGIFESRLEALEIPLARSTKRQAANSSSFYSAPIKQQQRHQSPSFPRDSSQRFVHTQAFQEAISPTPQILSLSPGFQDTPSIKLSAVLDQPVSAFEPSSEAEDTFKSANMSDPRLGENGVSFLKHEEDAAEEGDSFPLEFDVRQFAPSWIAMQDLYDFSKSLGSEDTEC